jgi:uncharacterized protein (TIGR03067 family)
MSTWLTLLVLGVLVPAGGRDQDAALSRLRGKWRIASVQMRDCPNATVSSRGLVVTFSGNTMRRYNEQMEVEMVATIKLAPKERPKRIDILYRNPVIMNPNAPVLGIYDIDGDRLTLCLCYEPRGSRPETFDLVPDQERVIFVLNRVKE